MTTNYTFAAQTLTTAAEHSLYGKHCVKMYMELHTYLQTWKWMKYHYEIESKPDNITNESKRARKSFFSTIFFCSCRICSQIGYDFDYIPNSLSTARSLTSIFGQEKRKAKTQVIVCVCVWYVCGECGQWVIGKQRSQGADMVKVHSITFTS